MGKDHDLVIAAKTGNLNAVEKILVQKAKRTGPLASLEACPMNIKNNDTRWTLTSWMSNIDTYAIPITSRCVDLCNDYDNNIE
ncbi:ankyrin repeat and sterile alpha motif domain-containing protein 1B-like isoform X2 [Aphis craccivora]|uniref:Ankyrin repeat and sterile alpha motif domain-containing protein 1B-like isoform X2 n=1 Tax=Aphis craccivora TaxID=307492 RepID=A0A6G0ZQL3_APHCR|nr:ankyrin repeat and sterile alpha motif domain-containing protein 1B-like isoform X2 [Aphis craccivora]